MRQEPHRRPARQWRPQTPLPRAPRVASGPRGIAGTKDRAGRAGGRGKALALPRRAPLCLLVVHPLRCAPGRWPSVRLRGSHAATRRMLLAAAARPAAPAPALPHRLQAPPPGLPCAASCRVRGRCGVRRCGGRRPATPLSPTRAKGPAEGRGRRPRSLGFAPRRAGRTRSRRLPAGSPPAASGPTAQRPPVSTGAASASGPACTGQAVEKRERKRRPSQPTEGTALLHCLLPNLLTSNDKYNYWRGRPGGPGRRGITTRSQPAGTGWQRVGVFIVPSPLDKKKLGYPRILENINLPKKEKSVLSSKVCFYLKDFLIFANSVSCYAK